MSAQFSVAAGSAGNCGAGTSPGKSCWAGASATSAAIGGCPAGGESSGCGVDGRAKSEVLVFSRLMATKILPMWKASVTVSFGRPGGCFAGFFVFYLHANTRPKLDGLLNIMWKTGRELALPHLRGLRARLQQGLESGHRWVCDFG